MNRVEIFLVNGAKLAYALDDSELSTFLVDLKSKSIVTVNLPTETSYLVVSNIIGVSVIESGGEK